MQIGQYRYPFPAGRGPAEIRAGPRRNARSGTGQRRVPEMDHIVGVMTTSTRRFMARPELLEFEVIGSFIPRPE